MFCGYCGKENADDYSFCSKCGKPLKSDVQNKDTHSTSTSIPPSDTHQEKLDTEIHKADIPLKSDVQNKDIQSTPTSIISTDTHQENPDTETHKTDIPQSNYISVHWWKDCEWPWQAKSLDDKELLGNYETELEAAEAVAKFHGTNSINLLTSKFSTESEKEEKRKLLCKEVLEKKNSTHAKPKSSELTTEKQKISKNKIPVNSSNTDMAMTKDNEEEKTASSEFHENKNAFVLRNAKTLSTIAGFLTCGFASSEVKWVKSEIIFFFECGNPMWVEGAKREALKLTSDSGVLKHFIKVEKMKSKEIALLIIRNVVIDKLTSGREHTYRGILGLSGQHYLEIFYSAVNASVALGFMPRDEAEEEFIEIRKAIKEVG